MGFDQSESAQGPIYIIKLSIEFDLRKASGILFHNLGTPLVDSKFESKLRVEKGEQE